MKIVQANKLICFVTIFLLFSTSLPARDSTRAIHVFVALCDNEHQGIVPVPASLGNGEDPVHNLYWGALYGVKTFFKSSNSWKLVSTTRNPKPAVLERCLFEHQKYPVYMVADAYKGSEIKQTVIDFLESASGNMQDSVSIAKDSVKEAVRVGGSADLVVYLGHDGLMDFSLEKYPERFGTESRDAIILACASKTFFSEPLRMAGANVILWTTGLMSPEAYTLGSALDGWILNESKEQIRIRAAKAYSKYQKCGLNAAKNLFATGR